MVEPASRAAIEFGSEGLIIEVAADSQGQATPRCDAAQAIDPKTLKRIVDFITTRAMALLEHSLADAASVQRYDLAHPVTR